MNLYRSVNLIVGITVDADIDDIQFTNAMRNNFDELKSRFISNVRAYAIQAGLTNNNCAGECDLQIKYIHRRTGDTDEYEQRRADISP